MRRAKNKNQGYFSHLEGHLLFGGLINFAKITNKKKHQK